MKEVLKNIKSKIEKITINSWLKLTTFIMIISLFLVIFNFKFKINKINKHNIEVVKEKEDRILELELYILEVNDYQKIKKEYVQESDTNRIITKYIVDSLLTRYYY